MNKRDKELALKASDSKTGWLDRQKFAELIRADEREACANIDFYEILRDICSKAQAQEYSNYVETAIRARGNT